MSFVVMAGSSSIDPGVALLPIVWSVRFPRVASPLLYCRAALSTFLKNVAHAFHPISISTSPKSCGDGFCPRMYQPSIHTRWSWQVLMTHINQLHCLSFFLYHVYRFNTTNTIPDISQHAVSESFGFIFQLTLRNLWNFLSSRWSRHFSLPFQ